jgi:hypothetical protein
MHWKSLAARVVLQPVGVAKSSVPAAKPAGDSILDPETSAWAPWRRTLCSAEIIAFPCDHPGLGLGHTSHRVASAFLITPLYIEAKSPSAQARRSSTGS